jgi:hypothetical protein
LPCSCGKKLLVEASQAGEEVHCLCGAVLEVPTMKGLAALERAAPAERAKARKKKWGARQRVLLVGILVMAIGLGVAGWCRLFRPVLIDIQLLTPAQSWVLWQRLQGGLGNRQRDEIVYVTLRRWNSYWIRFGLALAAAGAASVAGSFLIPDQRRRRPPVARALDDDRHAKLGGTP